MQEMVAAVHAQGAPPPLTPDVYQRRNVIERLKQSRGIATTRPQPVGTERNVPQPAAAHPPHHSRTH